MLEPTSGAISARVAPRSIEPMGGRGWLLRFSDERSALAWYRAFSRPQEVVDCVLAYENVAIWTGSEVEDPARWSRPFVSNSP